MKIKNVDGGIKKAGERKENPLQAKSRYGSSFIDIKKYVYLLI